MLAIGNVILPSASSNIFFIDSNPGGWSIKVSPLHLGHESQVEQTGCLPQDLESYVNDQKLKCILPTGESQRNCRVLPTSRIPRAPLRSVSTHALPRKPSLALCVRHGFGCLQPKHLVSMPPVSTLRP